MGRWHLFGASGEEERLCALVAIGVNERGQKKFLAIHVRTTNPVESSFATVRQRTDRTKGCLTRNGMLAMICKLAMAAKRGWKRLRGFHWLAKVTAGVKFRDGIEVLRENMSARTQRQPSRAAA